MGEVFIHKTRGSVLSIIWGIICTFTLFISVMYSPMASAQISSQDVYDNPDNHELNLEYAKQQILKGEMLDAGSALERMLYANPNWHSARLLYAAVLYRLDDQKAALRELSLLEGKDLNPEQLAKLDTYKAEFEIPPKPVQSSSSAWGVANYDTGSSLRSRDYIQAQLSVEGRYDDNAGNALTDARFGFNDGGDASAVLKLRVRTFAPVSDNVIIRAEVSEQIRRHETFSNVDYDVLDASVGITSSNKHEILAIDVDARRINIDGERYLHQVGPRITVSEKVSETTFASASLSFYNQDYSNLSSTTLEEERDGLKITAQVGILTKIDARNTARLAIGYETKSADLGAFAYNGLNVTTSLDHKIGKDLYIKARGKVRWLNYDDSLASDNGRNDARVAGRIAVGKYLNLSGKKDSKSSVKSAAIEFGANWNKRGSNITINTFENFGVDTRLTIAF